MSTRKGKPRGHRYRIVESFPWIEGGRPALRYLEIVAGVVPVWDGGRHVIYEPGETAYFEDQDLRSVYRRLEALDDAGRAALDKVRAEAEAPARRTAVASLHPDQRSSLAWELATARKAQGEGEREALVWAIRNCAELPADAEIREWIGDVLEGKHDPKRGRGRPKKRKRPDMIRAAVQHGVRETYDRWLADFKRDRKWAWVCAEAQRLRREQPDAEVWRQRFDTYTEEGRKSFEAALKNLGARPCLPALRGGKPARDLALAATAEECSPRWESLEGKRLTPAAVARIVTRAKKSE